MMSNTFFSFRQFTVHQDRCAMKVGTDGVLLGAWARGGHRILDIGCGTGVIALMMAQRFADAQVTAIDIDADACGQARQNADDSDMRSRISIVHAPLQTFNDQPFDCIVANPPFFPIGPATSSAARDVARHIHSLTFAELMEGAARLLSPAGIFSAIIPSDAEETLLAEGFLHGLRICRKTYVKTTPHKPPKRVLIDLSTHVDSQLTETHVLLDADGNRSEWYRRLTANFYL